MKFYYQGSNLNHLSCYISNCSNNNKKSWIQKLHIKCFSKLCTTQLTFYNKPSIAWKWTPFFSRKNKIRGETSDITNHNKSKHSKQHLIIGKYLYFTNLQSIVLIMQIYIFDWNKITTKWFTCNFLYECNKHAYNSYINKITTL